MNHSQKLRKLVFQGLQKKFTIVTDELLDRINYELSHFKSEKLCQYLLNYKRIIDVCNELNLVRSPGRGSPCSLLMNYCLDITTINPLEYNLHAEKVFYTIRAQQNFDIQSDIPAMSRTLLIENLQDKFAGQRVAKVLIPVKEIDEDNNQQIINIDGVAYKPHVCTIVIVPAKYGKIIKRDGNYYLPLNDYRKEILEIWHFRYNLLSLPHLNPIQKLVDEKGVKYHPRNYPIDDNATFMLFTKGKTKGIYGFETDAMKGYLKQMKPNQLKDLSLLYAAFRPQLLHIIPAIIKAKHSEQNYYGTLDIVRRMAEDSYGGVFYQETFVEIIEMLAGVSRKKAWYYYTMLGREKKQEVMDEFPIIFIEGCKQRGLVSEKDAKFLAANIVKNAYCSFLKSHSDCYGLMAYWMGYFNVHYKSLF
ncbi:hypothetical protein [uncultured Draconibacterium sp.]|uniref:hypothetical protein n=1 Tax=uncultured Draconibacterium sp. TaxID=1573823 RepID=UPI0032179AF0